MVLWMSAAGMGGEAQDEDEEDRDKEEVVILGDARCPAMRAGAAFRVAAASAAATAERIEAISSGCELVTGGCKGPVVVRRPGGPTWLAAVCRKGLGLWSPRVG